MRPTTDATHATDDKPWEECLVREFNGTLKPGRDDMLRFVEHSHDTG
jgi:hypothetical protein